ncbi:MAG: hypothetical protein JWQ96_672 [Segetibacter sp.]|nr:hypothetical protein [Segetibacter sp.]
MKRQSLSVIAKQFVVTTAAAFILIIGSSHSSKAAGATDKKEVVDRPVKISYLGLKDNRVMFDVEFANKDGQKFFLDILNESNEVLYTKRYSEAAFSKKISFDKTSEETVVTISVRWGKKEYSETFKIKPESNYVTDLLVTRL